jgi:hypothetical protein
MPIGPILCEGRIRGIQTGGGETIYPQAKK